MASRLFQVSGEVQCVRETLGQTGIIRLPGSVCR